MVNLFFRYHLDDTVLFNDPSFTKDVAVTLNIGNLFDTDTPVYKLVGTMPGGTANGQTLGRLFELGFSKKF